METRRPVNPAAEEILGGYFPVLDHGFVALVDYMGTDETVERAARVSYGHGTRARSETRTLLRYLRRHRHTTPSEMVELQFHCAMPIFVARQWVRHRSASLNEYSARYSLMPLLFYKPQHASFGLQSRTNRQGRSDAGAAEELYAQAVERWERVRASVSDTYGWLLSEDVARELARIDLPLSTYTQWYWKIDLHNLMHFLSLRVDDHAQWEIREYARVIAGILKRVAPISYEAWIDYDLCGERFSAAELEVLRQFVSVEAGEEGVAPREGSRPLTADALRGFGLTKREARELVAKLQPRQRPDFELDLSRMRPAAEIEAEMRAAVPVAAV